MSDTQITWIQIYNTDKQKIKNQIPAKAKVELVLLYKENCR